MNLEDRVSSLESSLEASRFVISALLGASPNPGKVALLLNLFSQKFEEDRSGSSLLSEEQRKTVLELLAKYEQSAIQIADAAR